MALTGEWTGTISGNVTTMSHNPNVFGPGTAFDSSATISNSTDLSLVFNAAGLPPNLPANLPVISGGGLFGPSASFYFPPTKFSIGDTESRAITTSNFTSTSGGMTTANTSTSTTTFKVTNATKAPDHFLVVYDLTTVTASTSSSPPVTTTSTTTGTLSFDALVAGNSMAVTVQFSTNSLAPTSDSGTPPPAATGQSSATLVGTLTRG